MRIFPLRRPPSHRRVAPARQTGLIAALFAAPLFGMASAEGLKLLMDSPYFVVLDATALGTALLGGALALSIRGAGIAASRSPEVLARMLRASIHAAAAGLVVLLTLQTAVVLGALWLLAGAMGVRMPIEIGLLAAAAAAFGIAEIARGTYRLLRPSPIVVTGTRLMQPSGDRMIERVLRLADVLRAPRIDNVVVGLEPGVFVTAADVRCVDATLSGRTLYCPLLLMRMVSLAELDALVGHELRHAVDARTRPSAFPPAPPTLRQRPALWTLSLVDDAFAQAEDRHARERAVMADRDAAKVAGPLDVASAFAKAHAMASLWTRIEEAAAKSDSGRTPRNLSKAAAELAVSPGETAIALIDGVESLEERLSAEHLVGGDGRPAGAAPPVPRRVARRRTAL